MCHRAKRLNEVGGVYGFLTSDGRLEEFKSGPLSNDTERVAFEQGCMGTAVTYIG